MWFYNLFLQLAKRGGHLWPGWSTAEVGGSLFTSTSLPWQQ